jgi:hypothetical protein
MITRSQVRSSPAAMEVGELALRPKALTPTATIPDPSFNSHTTTHALPSSPSRKRKASDMEEQQVVSSTSSTLHRPESMPTEMFGTRNEVRPLLNLLRDHVAPMLSIAPMVAIEQVTVGISQEAVPSRGDSTPSATPFDLPDSCAATKQREECPDSSENPRGGRDVAGTVANTLNSNADDKDTSRRASLPCSAQVPADDMFRQQEPAPREDQNLVASGEGQMLSEVYDAPQVRPGMLVAVPRVTALFMRSSIRRSRKMYRIVSARTLGSYASFREKVLGKIRVRKGLERGASAILRAMPSLTPYRIQSCPESTKYQLYGNRRLRHAQYCWCLRCLRCFAMIWLVNFVSVLSRGWRLSDLESYATHCVLLATWDFCSR